MLAMFAVSLAAALVLCCLLFPSMWATMACDEILDAHEAGLALVSTRKALKLRFLRRLWVFNAGVPGNPVRENGPPACMAKLIMLRHKVRPRFFLPLRIPVAEFPHAYSSTSPTRSGVAMSPIPVRRFSTTTLRPPDHRATLLGGSGVRTASSHITEKPHIQHIQTGNPHKSKPREL